uniref:FMN-binding negative transcriptional regulator n=1 Tax=Streptomyces sp. IBSBF 2435 TaxID=2903531 RepID=UPI002FDC4A23
PHATHVPVVLPPGAPADGPLTGCGLLGHMDRGNPHWKSLTDGLAARLMFDGPCGYVTPTLYRTTPAAPTWDFTSVHLHGTVHPVQDPQETLDIVSHTVRTLEEAFGDKWDLAESLDYFRQIAPGVGAFHFRVTHVDAIFKLSQEKTPDVQERVIRRFEADDERSGRQLARLMRGIGLGTPSGTPAAT